MNVFRTLAFPDLFSLSNALFGFAAVINLIGEGPVHISVLFVLMAAASDGIDGFLARRMRTSALGSNLDSLADLISFGAAPASIAIAPLAGACYRGHCRRFPGLWNSKACQVQYISQERQIFEGLPITASGTVASASVLLDSEWFTIPLMILLSGLMVSGIRYPKMRDYRAVFVMLLIIIVAAYLSFYGSKHSMILILIALFGYLLSPVVMSCLQKRR
jgi:phosphatidylserine synthase